MEEEIKKAYRDYFKTNMPYDILVIKINSIYLKYTGKKLLEK